MADSDVFAAANAMEAAAAQVASVTAQISDLQTKINVQQAQMATLVTNLSNANRAYVQAKAALKTQVVSL